jgi:N-acetylneuraminic acid mutarotase
MPAILGAQPAFSTNGLVAFFPFNANANDESGNGLSGTAFGGPVFTTDRFGRPGRALWFDGVEDYVAVTGSSLNISNTITLVGFLKYEGNNTNNGGGLNGILERGITSNVGGYGLRLDYGGVMSGTLANPYQQFNATQKPMDTNRWYHFAVAYDGAFMRMYVDGLLVASYAAGPNRLPGTSALNGYVLSIGREAAYFWGALDDLRLYNRALSDSEVGSLYAYERYLEPTWDAAGTMLEGRKLHATTLLQDGRVLVTGGESATGNVASAEVYYPNTNGWALTGPMPVSRREHTATLLDNGKVLVAGGVNSTGTIAVCHLYDPATGLWSVTGSLNSGRFGHTATRLANGKVIVAAGCFGGSQISTAEVYDPATGQWTLTGALTTPRCNHAATALNDGRVMVCGGYQGTTVHGSVEIYNPANGSWTSGQAMSSPRYAQTATLLLNGKVLVAGGAATASGGTPLTTAELYDPAVNLWSTVGSLSTNRYFHAATLLANGDVLVAGGRSSNGVNLASAELYSPPSGQWANTAGLRSGRFWFTTTLMPSGRVLAAGGYGDGGQHFTQAESYVIPPPRRATAVAIITNGTVVGIRILDRGYGYGDAPAVLVLGGGGSGATAVATVVNGVVTAITVTNPGSGYTSTPTVSIASPPFSPELSVEISKVRVRMKVVLGRRYILESSFNLSSWTQIGDPFVAQAEELAQEFDVNTTGRFFRVTQVP